jgi:hypothetical protein
MRLKDERVLKKAMKEYIEGRMPAGRPRQGWLEAVGKYAKRTLKCGKWRLAEDRDGWRRRIEEAKARRRKRTSPTTCFQK